MKLHYRGPLGRLISLPGTADETASQIIPWIQNIYFNITVPLVTCHLWQNGKDIKRKVENITLIEQGGK